MKNSIVKYFEHDFGKNNVVYMACYLLTLIRRQIVSYNDNLADG